MDTLNWYGAKSVICHRGISDSPANHVYEERIVLLKARTLDEALQLAQAETSRYVSNHRHAELAGYVIVYDMQPDAPGEGIEVFSVMRDSSMEPDKFMERFYPAADERSQ